MIEINELQTLVPPELLGTASQEVADEILEAVAQSARDHWIKLADDDPSHLRFDYLEGIQEVRTFKGQVIISLIGELAHLLEDGSTEVDMRTFLLNKETTPIVPRGQRGMHMSKEGNLYRSIPIRHTTPGEDRGKIAGLEMGSPYADAVKDAKKLGRDIYGAALALKAGQRLKPGTGGAFPLANKFSGAKHKTDIYAGMIKEETFYGKKQQPTYTTFRTISEKGAGQSWMRSPITARHYAEKVSAFAARLIPTAFGALGGE